MGSTARLFYCRRCTKQTLICCDCDRGNQYCSADCTRAARRQGLREAGQRYQNSFRGRIKHAARQHRYRQRQRDKVTHHRSPTPGLSALLSKRQRRLSSHPQPETTKAGQPYHCDFCGKPCSEFIRSGYLRHSGRAPPPLFPPTTGGYYYDDI